MQTADPLFRLERVLAAEEALYVEMHRTLQDECAALAALDSDLLEQAVRSKESLSDEASFLEERRVEAARALAEDLGIEPEPPTLTRICDALGDRGQDLRESHSRLSALIGAVRELLAINAAFAGDCLGQVSSSLRLLGRLLPDHTLYAPSGAMGRQSGGRLVRGCA